MYDKDELDIQITCHFFEQPFTTNENCDTL